MRFSGQLLLLQVAVVAAVIALGFGLFTTLLDRQRSSEYGQRALAIARSVAADTELRAAVAEFSRTDIASPSLETQLAGGPVQLDAESVRQRTGALFVVVVDDRGIRLSHPDQDELGDPVSTDPSRALAGQEEVTEQFGTLGESARAKVPVYAPDGGAPAGTVVGAVSVGIASDEIDAALWTDLRIGALYAAAAFAVGIGASVLLNRRLRRLTLGVEPEELAALATEHEAVLGGIDEAVIGVDPQGRVTVANAEARRFFAVPLPPGTPIADAGLPDGVCEMLVPPVLSDATVPPVRADTVEEPRLVVVGERVLVCTRRTVHRGRHDLGVVLTARDRTDLELLTRQLDAVQTMSTALRAQRHEFANRLHVVHGLLAHDRPDEAAEFVDAVLGSGPLGATLPGLDAIGDPVLQAFLSAKAAHARERGVLLRIGPESWLDRAVTDQVAVTTVLGNLIDNACDAAASAVPPAADPLTVDRAAWVEVEVLTDGDTLFVTVADSGDGIVDELGDRVFEQDVSTRAVSGRGLGLGLVRQVARALGGDVWIADPGSGGGTGAVFVARLPGAVAERAGHVSMSETAPDAAEVTP
ncbi:sensor histidine kinase [Nakamurella flava]|uniref:Sensor-like histidine kinase SenX3 n=1 Tax=Nakamurella flava TaxID=2576308 RepID=A0A4U6QN82_9ACTN|nr:sensor histidine kinase [Nakamurella flava]